MNGEEEEELLYRLDERTKRIEEEHLRILREMSKDVGKNTENIESLQKKVKRNTTILGGVGTGVTAVFLWISDKFTRFL